MTAQLIDGKKIAKLIREQVSSHVSSIISSGRRPPGLAVILVGSDAASQVYVKNKCTACEEVGFLERSYDLPATTTREELVKLIETLNQDNDIDGILVQLPLPAGLDASEILEKIHPHKDVDGFHPENVGRLWSGEAGLVPATPMGLIRILDHFEICNLECYLQKLYIQIVNEVQKKFYIVSKHLIFSTQKFRNMFL